MEDDFPEIIHSPLSQSVEMDGECVHIEIYRSEEDSGWVMEVEDVYGNTTVFNGTFKSDDDALIAAKHSIKTEGIHAFVGDPS